MAKQRDPLFVFEAPRQPLRAAHSAAMFSPEAEPRYRYAAWRMAAIRTPYVNVVLLAPGMGGHKGDATVERLARMRFAQGFGGVVVTAAYARRATSGEQLVDLARAGEDVVGDPKNAEALAVWGANAAAVVCAWGPWCDRVQPGRSAAVAAFLRAAGVARLFQFGEGALGLPPPLSWVADDAWPVEMVF